MSASRIRTLGVSALIAAALIVSLTAFAQRTTTPADAADAETTALIGYFNQYRSQIGVPLLSVSSSMNAATQQSAQNAVNNCSHAILPSGSGTKWGGYGFTSAAQMWSIYQQDSYILGIIGRSDRRSVGVGRATAAGCNLSPYWVMWVSSQGGDGPVPTAPPSATPTKSPTPTTGPVTPTPTLQPTSTPTFTLTPSATPISSPTASPFPTHTPPPLFKKGDTDCNGVIDMWDGLLILMLTAGIAVPENCLDPVGLNCTGAVDAADALPLVQYLGRLPRTLPSGCDDVGVEFTPAPTPTPAITPVPTAIATPTSSPTGGPTGPIAHCFLAQVAYEITYWLTLQGPVTCAPDGGVAYTCDFQTPGNQAICTSGSLEAPSYDCYVWGSSVPPFGLCESLAETPDYDCYSFGTGVECLPHQAGPPLYACAVTGEQVACSTDTSGYPDFTCTRVETTFDCALP